LRDVVLRSVCDRLTALDATGTPQPSLATAWRVEGDGRTWLFTLRDGVAMQDGTTLAPQTVIAALTAQNPGWHFQISGKDLRIDTDAPIPGMPFELAELHNSICVAGADGRWIGSGPFQISDFRAGQYVELQAFDDSWHGRSFLDRVRIQMSRSLADQVSDFQLARAEAIESDPTQARPTNSSTGIFSRPVEVIALAFTPNHPAASDQRIREALARSIDRNSIFTVLLRRQGEPSAALLPEWISGYAHLFNSAQDLGAAVRLRNQAAALSTLSLVYDGTDELARLIAERVSLNAREAGITLQPRPESPMFRSFDADVRLVRLRIESPDAASALVSIGNALDNPTLQRARSAPGADQLFAVENDALKDFSIIPIAHVPESFSVASSVHDWSIGIAGGIDLGNLWMESPR
jgi:peptide/nickel transport system substrate-binding protein